MKIKAFEAVRPTVEMAGRVAAVPYDTVDLREARAIAEGNPWSFLRVTRPDLEIGDAPDGGDDALHRRSARNFSQFRQAGVLVQDEEASLFVYRLD